MPLELYSTFQHTPTTILTTGRLGNKQADKKRKKSGDKEPPASSARAKKVRLGIELERALPRFIQTLTRLFSCARLSERGPGSLPE